MILSVQKFQAPDGKLFDTYKAAESHWKVQEGIIKANDAYYQGASLWAAIKYIPSKSLWSEWRNPSELLKLVHSKSIFWHINDHVRVWRIDPDLSIVTWRKNVHEGSYSWDGGYMQSIGLYALQCIVKEHATNRGFASAEPAREHWYNRKGSA